MEAAPIAAALPMSRYHLHSESMPYEMRPSDEQDVVYAKGEVKMRWVSQAQSKSILLPALVRRLALCGAFG